MKNSEANMQKLMEYIKAYKTANGYNPSIRDMANHLSIKSTNTVHYYLRKLEDQGLLKRVPLKNRAIMVEPNKKFSSAEITAVPLLGNVAAGKPILAEENYLDTYFFPSGMFRGNQNFMLKVRGDSMIDAGILDGDFVMIQKQSTAENGEIVCAMLDNSATIKTFYKEKGQIRLQPQNNFYEPILTKDAVILGKVVGVIRMY